MENNNWFSVAGIEQIDSPALLIYRERVIENIRRATAMVKNVKLLRPHVKTNKIAEVCLLMMEEGITSFKCATIAEAEMLGMIYAPDVLLAYQPVGPKIKRFAELVTTYPKTKFSCLTDNTGTASEIAATFSSAGLVADVFIDLNTGMNRTGIVPGDAAFELYKTCLELSGIRPLGLHAYDGHIKAPDAAARKAAVQKVFEPVDTMKTKIAEYTGMEPAVVAGGSPSFDTHALREDVQCSPGTFVFWDWGYAQSIPEDPFEFAALVITRVISILDNETICTDLGYKAVAAENPLPRVHFLNAPDAIPFAHSEEHLVLKVPDTGRYKAGDILYGVPTHICPTVAHYNKAYVVENKRITGTWNVVARNRSIKI